MYVHIYAKHISFASSFSARSYAAHTTQYTLNCGVVSLLEIAKHSLNIIKSIWYRNSTPENRQTLAKPIDRAQNPILFNSRESEREKLIIFSTKKKRIKNENDRGMYYANGVAANSQCRTEKIEIAASIQGR